MSAGLLGQAGGVLGEECVGFGLLAIDICMCISQEDRCAGVVQCAVAE